MKIEERLGRYTSVFSKREWSEFSSNRPESNKIYLKFKTFMSLLINMPAFVFHETCHVLAMVVLQIDFKVEEFRVFKYIKSTKKFNLYTLTIKMKGIAGRNKIASIVSIAPLLGYVLGLITMILTAALHFGLDQYGYATVDLCIMLYMTRYYKSFSLSEVDKNSFKQIRL